jgi:hypothetical protein
MNNHFNQAKKDYEESFISFEQIIGWHLVNGFVLNLPCGFAFGYYTQKEDASNACDAESANSIFVTYATGALRPLCHFFYDKYEWIIFAREFKNSDRLRVLNMKQFYGKLK